MTLLLSREQVCFTTKVLKSKLCEIEFPKNPLDNVYQIYSSISRKFGPVDPGPTTPEFCRHDPSGKTSRLVSERMCRDGTESTLYRPVRELL